MELKNYLAPLLKWWWLVLLAVVIAGGTTFVATRGLPSSYQSRTTLLVGQSLNNPNPSGSQFALEQQLAAIYADMAQREPIRRAVMNALGTTGLPSYVARALPQTQLIEITVTHSDPVQAQQVAAEIARQLVLRGPTSVSQDDQDRQAFVDAQLASLQQDIEATQAEIDRLNASVGSLNSAQELADVQRQLAALETKRTTLQGNYASLLATTQKGALNTLTVVEPAEIPTRPVGSNRMLTVILAAVLGGVLAGAGAFVIEAIDLTIRDADEAARVLGQPVLAEMPRLPPGSKATSYAYDQPLSVFSDAFRTLRTNLEVAGQSRPIRSLVVTSAGMGDGKSTMATNLALSLARLNRRVILVDADFHRSNLAFENEKGLSDVLAAAAHPIEYLIPWVQPNLFVLANGSQPTHLSEMLGSPLVSQLLHDLEQISDIVIIDCPPLSVSDTLALAVKADAALLVVRPRWTRRFDLARAKNQLERANINVVGFITNAVAARIGYYHAYYTDLPPRNGANGTAGAASRGKKASRAAGGRAAPAAGPEDAEQAPPDAAEPPAP